MTDMHYEVVDAVVEYYKGADEDIAADCLVYLSCLSPATILHSRYSPRINGTMPCLWL